MTQKQIEKHIQYILKSLVLRDLIPDEYTGDIEELALVVEYFKKRIVSIDVVDKVIHDILFSDVLKNYSVLKEYVQKNILVKEIGILNISNIANEIFLELSSLPKKYLFVFKLPKYEGDALSVKFRPSFENVTVDRSFFEYINGKTITKSTTTSDLFTNESNEQSQIKEGDLVLKVTGRGYISRHGFIKMSIMDPLYMWKVVMGIYLVKGIIRRKKEYQTIGNDPFTYKVYSKPLKSLRTFTESNEDFVLLNSMRFDLPAPISVGEKSKDISLFDNANLLITNLFSLPKVKNRRNKDVLKRQQIMLRNGAYWYYESFKTPYDHLQVIYMTTAFDSLLGTKGPDDSKERKAELVSNSIARDAVDAANITTDVIELYALRNKIVHGSMELSSLEHYGQQKHIQYNTFSKLPRYLIILQKFIRNRIDFTNKGFIKSEEV